MDDLKCPCVLHGAMVSSLECPYICFRDAITALEFVEADLAGIDPEIYRLPGCIEVIGNLLYCEKSFVFH